MMKLKVINVNDAGIHFDNGYLQESDAGFGNTPDEAVKELIKQTKP